MQPLKRAAAGAWSKPKRLQTGDGWTTTGEWRRKDVKCYDDDDNMTHTMIDNDLECLWRVIHEQDGPRVLPDSPPSGTQDGPPTPPMRCSQQ